MFKSYQYIGVSGYRSYQYKIVDDDFEDIAVGCLNGLASMDAIINCYIKRGLPVAPNVFRYMLHMRHASSWSLDSQVKWNKANNHHWPLIEKDIQMYMVFS
jgi:hypothetical protein